MMTPTEVQKCIQAISQTGFMLESRVATLLREKQWSVLGNRYYLDDITAVPREIDLIAYRARAVSNVMVYTTLIISCKKSDQNAWVFLTKNLDKQDKNIELHPVNLWSNSKVLVHQNIRQKMTAQIDASISRSPLVKTLFDIERNVFAYQEVNLLNGTPQNDKRIYDSITSCIKAMEYERNALKARKRDPTLYQFLILNIVESKLIEYFCDVDPPSVAQTNHIKYLNRFIVNKADDFRIIHFVTDAHLELFLKAMDEYHEWSITRCKDSFDQYKASFLADYGLRNLFADEILKDIRFAVSVAIEQISKEKHDAPAAISLGTDDKHESLIIDIGISDEGMIDKLNSNDWLRKRVASSLKERALYEGKFKFGIQSFEDDIPF